VRPATIAAVVLVCAAAAMVVVAFATGGEEERAASAPAPTAAAAPPVPAAAREGEAVWVANGCGSCHSFAPADAEGVFGPNLSATLKGMPASYIRESIVNPDKVAAAGFSTGMMPDDYGARIQPAELDALVGYLRSGVRD
jgi:mono/diheme cytochrome c family protein